MSEALDLTPPDDEGPDALALSALISSRVCHDLINPVGALSSGLQVLDDPSMEGSMREAAMDLIRAGAQISLEDAQKALAALFEITKADLDWKIGTGLAAKENVKVLMVLAYAAADCVPRGGVVSITGSIDDFTVTATGKKVLLNDDLVRALGGDAGELTPKHTPALIASQLVAAAGGRLTADRTEEAVTFRAIFSR